MIAFVFAGLVIVLLVGLVSLWDHVQHPHLHDGEDEVRPTMLKHFIQITKLGSALSVTCLQAVFLASKGHVVWPSSSNDRYVPGGCSGCVFNNCIDRITDIKMERTKNRVLVQGHFLVLALIFATVLGAFAWPCCAR